MMVILSLLLCDPSACSRELLSSESSDCDLGGVILEKKKQVIDFIYVANMNRINEKLKGKKSFQTFLRGL